MSLHIVNIVTLVIAHLAHVQPLLAVSLTIVLFKVVFVCTFEAAVCAGMRVTVSLVESMIVFSIVIHTLAYKDTLLTRIVLLPLMVYFNVFLHYTVLVTLKHTPSTNTLQISLSKSSRQTLQRLYTVL
jgi:hypothetical protein